MAAALGALCLIGIEGKDVAAQTASDSLKSLYDGVYSQKQAQLGGDVYAGMCAGCHTVESHTAEPFLAVWRGKPLWDLVKYVRESMPQMDPGSLSRDEYAQVMAYLLQLNGLPPGADDLPADSVALKKIRFDVPVRGQQPFHPSLHRR